MKKKRKKFKSIRYDDEERMMFNGTIEAYMLRLKRHPVPDEEPSWNTIINETQKEVPRQLQKLWESEEE